MKQTQIAKELGIGWSEQLKEEYPGIGERMWIINGNFGLAIKIIGELTQTKENA